MLQLFIIILSLLHHGLALVPKKGYNGMALDMPKATSGPTNTWSGFIHCQESPKKCLQDMTRLLLVLRTKRSLHTDNTKKLRDVLTACFYRQDPSCMAFFSEDNLDAGDIIALCKLGVKVSAGLCKKWNKLQSIGYEDTTQPCIGINCNREIPGIARLKCPQNKDEVSFMRCVSALRSDLQKETLEALVLQYCAQQINQEWCYESLLTLSRQDGATGHLCGKDGCATDVSEPELSIDRDSSYHLEKKRAPGDKHEYNRCPPGSFSCYEHYFKELTQAHTKTTNIIGRNV